MVGAIPVTTPARTLLDICDVITPAVFEGALDDVLVRGLASLHTIRALLERTDGRGRAGITWFRGLVDERLAGRRPTESVLEDDLIGVIRRYGLPEPERQVPVRLSDGRKIRLDVAYTARRLDFEADGDEHHAGRLDREADAERDRLCELAGWTVRRFSTTDIRERPHAVAATIAALLGLRLAS
jgi:very-short-patch-repair endonuclease